MLTVKVGSDHALRRLLASHPRLDKWVPGESDATLEWEENGRVRRIYTARPDVALKGVVELVDNNPLVCADAFSVPGPASALALLALGPALDAGIVIERPTLLTNVETSEDEIAPFLETVGWTSGITVMGDAVDMEGAIAATAICAIKTPERLEDLDDLYDERYSRSFFVRRDESAEWHVNLIREKPWAAYRLRISPDMPYSLLTIQIMADLQGKCGAAQVVHAFNVMCGFEESLGIAE